MGEESNMERQERSPGSHQDQYSHPDHRAARNDSSKRKNNTSRLSGSTSRIKQSKDRGKRIEDSAHTKKRKFDNDKRNGSEVKEMKKNKTSQRFERQVKKRSRGKRMKEE